MYLISRLFTSMHYHTYRPKQVYDSILFKRHEKWFKRVLGLCETRGVAQNNFPSLNTALMLQEAVYGNTCVYVALLDVRKAIDSVSINGML